MDEPVVIQLLNWQPIVVDGYDAQMARVVCEAAKEWNTENLGLLVGLMNEVSKERWELN